MPDTLTRSGGLSRRLPAFCFCAFMTVAGLSSCRQQGGPDYREWHGETMGTYYTVKALTSEDGLQAGIDSLLAVFNAVFSTYDPASTVSKFNRSPDVEYCIPGETDDLRYTLAVSGRVHEETGGYFDPTVMPLVRYWGFSGNHLERTDVDSTAIDSLLRAVGWHLLDIRQEDSGLCLVRSVPGVELDFSAIAKGYGVDRVADYLASRGIGDYMVEIGGEIVAAGVSPRGSAWNIGIDKPESGSDLGHRENQAIVTLADRAIATSGNYRNFYEMNGKLVGHTINPATGYPEINDLLSVSVVTGKCLYADALATGFMAMGYARARAVADSLDDVEALFIRIADDGHTVLTDFTPGMQAKILTVTE